MTSAATSSTKDSLSVEERLWDTTLGHYVSDPSSRVVPLSDLDFRWRHWIRGAGEFPVGFRRRYHRDALILIEMEPRC